MVKHVVIYKLKDSNDSIKLKETFLSMKGKIDELLEINVGIDMLKITRSYDVCLECVFNSLDDMAKYKSNAVHLKIKDFVHSVVLESHSVDYNF